MPEPTTADVDALIGPATPHFAYQLRARVRELVMDLAPGHPVRRYAEEKMELLDRLGYASSKAEEGGRGPRSRPGWSEAAGSRAPGRAAAAREMSLEGASVLVTGGTRGIGLAIARRLVRDGASRAVLGYLRN